MPADVTEPALRDGKISRYETGQAPQR